MAKSPQRRSAAPVRFDPQSLDSQLAGILAEMKATKSAVLLRFDTQDTELKAIKEQAIKTNGRVGVLEMWRETSTAKAAGVAAALGAVGGVAVWLIQIIAR